MDLNWYRSWPSPGDWEKNDLGSTRPYVVDHLPKIILDSRGYQTVSEYNSLGVAAGTPYAGWPDDPPGFCMLEWDVALDHWSRAAFAAEALVEPREVLVAPYRLYENWCMWVGNDGTGPRGDSRPVKVGERTTDSFGVGCIYFPKMVLHEFLDQMGPHGFSDGLFGGWYNGKYGPARCTWRVHPQHLHAYGNDGIEVP